MRHVPAVWVRFAYKLFVTKLSALNSACFSVFLFMDLGFLVLTPFDLIFWLCLFLLLLVYVVICLSFCLYKIYTDCL